MFAVGGHFGFLGDVVELFLHHRAGIEDVEVVGVSGEAPQPVFLLEGVVVVFAIRLGTARVAPSVLVIRAVVVQSVVVVQIRYAPVVFAAQEVLSVAIGEVVVGFQHHEVEIVFARQPEQTGNTFHELFVGRDLERIVGESRIVGEQSVHGVAVVTHHVEGHALGVDDVVAFAVELRCQVAFAIGGELVVRLGSIVDVDVNPLHLLLVVGQVVDGLEEGEERRGVVKVEFFLHLGGCILVNRQLRVGIVVLVYIVVGCVGTIFAHQFFGNHERRFSHHLFLFYEDVPAINLGGQVEPVVVCGERREEQLHTLGRCVAIGYWIMLEVPPVGRGSIVQHKVGWFCTVGATRRNF